MDDTLNRIWTDLVGRLTGPMTFRLVMQPTMATLFALRDGLTDARTGRRPYLWRIFTHPEERRTLLTQAWKAMGKIFLLAIILDVVYEFTVFRRFYPVETLDVAIVLAVIPYVVVRGLICRIALRWRIHDAA